MKSLLILDRVYKTCSECPLHSCTDIMGVYCGVNHKPICEEYEDTDKKERASWCPLKELPEFESNFSITDEDVERMPDDFEISPEYMLGHEDGWNQCLEEIIGSEG